MADVPHLGFYWHATRNVSWLIIVKIHSKVIWAIRNTLSYPQCYFILLLSQWFSKAGMSVLPKFSRGFRNSLENEIVH